MSIESVMPSNHLILCHPLLLLPSIFPSIRVFSNESVLCVRWPKYWSFSFSISSSNEYSGSISFRIDWFDLLAVQGTLKSLLQHHGSKASIFQCSAFFLVCSLSFLPLHTENMTCSIFFLALLSVYMYPINTWWIELVLLKYILYIYIYILIYIYYIYIYIYTYAIYICIVYIDSGEKKTK